MELASLAVQREALALLRVRVGRTAVGDLGSSEMTDQPKERFFEDSDNSGHHYVVPVARIEGWRAWRDLPEDDERGWHAPDYATRIDGGRLTFTDWRIERV